MVGVFRRSISFPNKPTAKPPISHHVRSISLPSRSHPLIFQLNHHITNLRSWSSDPLSTTSDSLSNGLDRLRTLHNHLDDILNLDQSRHSLRRRPHWIENLLDQFLRFVDVYGTFRTLVLALKEEHSAALVAMRRRDEEKIAVYVKYRNRMARQLEKLVSTIQRQKTRSPERDGDGELASVIEDVIGATVSVSSAIFSGIVRLLGRRLRTRAGLWKGLWVSKKSAAEEENGIGELRELKKKGREEMKMVMKKMEDMEEWIEGIETGSHRVYRSLISARVSLLNALSQQAPEK